MMASFTSEIFAVLVTIWATCAESPVPPEPAKAVAIVCWAVLMSARVSLICWKMLSSCAALPSPTTVNIASRNTCTNASFMMSKTLFSTGCAALPSPSITSSTRPVFTASAISLVFSLPPMMRDSFFTLYVPMVLFMFCKASLCFLLPSEFSLFTESAISFR